MSATHDVDDRSAVDRRDRTDLFDRLDRIAVQGWDGPTGRRLLTAVRGGLARPLAVGAGLRGAAASQAEASAWQAAWEVLAFTDLRTIDEPWGVVWAAARRAVTGEIVGAAYATDLRRSWRLLLAGVRPLVGLEVFIEQGLDAISDAEGVGELTVVEACVAAVAALCEAGWSRCMAQRIITAVADLPDPGDHPEVTSIGWRTMAVELGLPPWQARRLCVTLLGTASWAGLLGRLILLGPSAARSTPMRAALRSTRVRRLRAPVLAAARAGDPFASSRPQAIAG